jgi:uncharacterized delta-60 repeat protein
MILRLNRDGSKDATFTPRIFSPTGAFTVQNDGKIVLLVDATAGNYGFVRLNEDGSRDDTFHSAVRTSGGKLVSAPDGKTVVVGAVVTEGALRRDGVARLVADGSLDADFDVGSGFTSSSSEDPLALVAAAVQPDGQVLVGGNFVSVDRFRRFGIVRLNKGGNYLKLAPPVRTDSGNWRIEATVRPGRTYLFESSADLSTWSPLHTNTASGFNLEFDDSDTGLFTSRFYRARRIE